ncbi:MAG: PepSY-associated TM helix domain-containing protein [Chitinophagaceae bacterium]
MKPFFRTIHLYLSLVSGLFIMIACFTGAVLVFENELMQAMHPQRYFVANKGELQLPVSAVTASLKQQLPDAKIGGVKIYTDPERTLEYSVTLPDANKPGGPKEEGKRVTAFVDPYTGKLIEVDSYGDTVFYTVMAMHRWLLGDDIGKLIMGISTLLFLFIMITGVILWWPKTKAVLKSQLTVMWSANWKRITRDLHYSLGIYSVLFLFIFAFTGLAWSFQWFNDGIYKVTNSSKEPIKPPKSVITDSLQEMATVDDVLSDAYTRVPNSIFYNVSFPKDSTAVYGVSALSRTAIHENATDNHYYDQYSGAYVKTVSWGDRPLGQRVRASFKPIHIASLWGLPTKILGFIVCLFGTTFPITGVIMWLNRIKKL